MDIEIYEIITSDIEPDEYELLRKFNTSKALPLLSDNVSINGKDYEIIEIKHVIKEHDYDFSLVKIYVR